METVLRVRAIQRLRHDLGVNLSGVAVILDLTKRLRLMQQELEWLRSRLYVLGEARPGTRMAQALLRTWLQPD